MKSECVLDPIRAIGSCGFFRDAASESEENETPGIRISASLIRFRRSGPKSAQEMPTKCPSGGHSKCCKQIRVKTQRQ